MSRPPRSHPPSPLFWFAPPSDGLDSLPKDPGRTEKSAGWAGRAGRSTERPAGSAPGRIHCLSKRELRTSTSRKSLADRELRGSKVYEPGGQVPPYRILHFYSDGVLTGLRLVQQERKALSSRGAIHGEPAPVERQDLEDLQALS